MKPIVLRHLFFRLVLGLLAGSLLGGLSAFIFSPHMNTDERLLDDWAKTEEAQVRDLTLIFVHERGTKAQRSHYDHRYIPLVLDVYRRQDRFGSFLPLLENVLTEFHEYELEYSSIKDWVAYLKKNNEEETAAHLEKLALLSPASYSPGQELSDF